MTIAQFMLFPIAWAIINVTVSGLLMLLGVLYPRAAAEFAEKMIAEKKQQAASLTAEEALESPRKLARELVRILIVSFLVGFSLYVTGNLV